MAQVTIKTIFDVDYYLDQVGADYYLNAEGEPPGIWGGKFAERLGLTGEVRPVAYGEERLREAHKQGFRIAVVPRENAPRKPLDGLQVLAVGRVGEALEAVFNRSQ